MKKTILATALIASAFLSGCASTGSDKATPAELQAEYQSVSAEQFKLSQINELSQVATTVNQLFEESYPIYQDYVAYVETTNGVGASHAAALTMIEDEADRVAYLEDVKVNKPAEFAEYKAFINDEHLNSIYKRAGFAALKAAAQAALIANIDTGSLISGSGLGFTDLATEKGVVSLMDDQVSVLNSTIVALSDEYEANKAAQAIK
ncbi:hypothetical protein EDB60_110149 [Vibrio crassostreae]|uniref:hypothetical protein n=1 Tax=Vibrio crassostreae TaxID=246167 RepID=UPI00104F6EFA|nr:hypothetical protein [Vibrio crassostreae]TCN66958.1 hypothetical protein EDB60_110149 [Vibrio crassostreae]TCW20192.1 hypothetical protein EDB48_104138 [Vibrio crassostreae]CAK3142358.1 conserved exported hypothetical protein [Vibrio crassostreae]CAK3156403.1 conserved exported hypothetical protein [Vibrio crassostreae]CAK3348704.1 conserved exported hypothetical protein [Vibrio crassostreae]